MTDLEPTTAPQPTAQPNEVIRGIASEFAAVIAFARSGWAGHAENVHPELRGVGLLVLQWITRCGRVSATAIAQKLDMDKAAVSRQVAKLRELGFVEVSSDPDDRRVQLLSLSAKGLTAIDELRGHMASDYAERFAGWSEDDLADLLAMLRRFNASA